MFVKLAKVLLLLKTKIFLLWNTYSQYCTTNQLKLLQKKNVEKFHLNYYKQQLRCTSNKKRVELLETY